MKKLILMFFALVFSVSASFGYRNYVEIRVNDVFLTGWCVNDGGTCLPTVIVEEQACE
jgi:hypothetical protein